MNEILTRQYDTKPKPSAPLVASLDCANDQSALVNGNACGHGGCVPLTMPPSDDLIELDTTVVAAAATTTAIETMATHSHCHEQLQQQQQPQPIVHTQVADDEAEARGRLIRKKFAQLEGQPRLSAPAPDVKIGQRVAYKEYYGNEFGTIRWIGRVPQISADWTVGVEFDNAIGEGDGSLHGRRYFIAKDCFAKFLPLANVSLVDQHVGRPEPGTMISVMSAAVRPGQMISIQRVSTVHVQHCFLNAPHRRPGAEFLAVNTRLHCQCPNCGPCAHVVKPPRTQRLRTHKNATHMCQFSTYTCCGMESSEDALCTYTGNKISSLPPPPQAGSRQRGFSATSLLAAPGNSWIEGAGYLSQLQAEQLKLMPQEYRLANVGPEQQHRRRSLHHGQNGRHRSYHHHQQQQQHHNGRRHHHDKGFSTKNEQSVNERSQVSRPSESSASLSCRQMALPTDKTNREPLVELDQSNDEKEAPLSDEEPSQKLVEARPAQRFAVYRDSIENRYLFPTDDAGPLDSTLEADLEDLSQARYGYFRPPWDEEKRGREQYRPRRSSCSSRHQLVKSLRSLVASCLSAASRRTSGSELDSRPATCDSRCCARSSPVSSSSRELQLVAAGAAPLNKSSAPAARSYSSLSSIVGSSASESRSSCSSPARHHHHHHHQRHHSKQRLYESPIKYHRQLELGDDSFAFVRQIHHHEVTCEGELPSSPLPLPLPLPPPPPPVQRHISSSSDCGFSSAASQNSCPGAIGQSQGELRASTELAGIYKRLASRLVASSPNNSITPEQLERLHAGLLELQAQRQPQDTDSKNELECCEQLLAQLLSQSYFRSPQSNGHKAVEPSLGQPRCEKAASQAGGLPRAFELKLTLSINEKDAKEAAAAAAAAAAYNQQDTGAQMKDEEASRQPQVDLRYVQNAPSVA